MTIADFIILGIWCWIIWDCVDSQKHVNKRNRAKNKSLRALRDKRDAEFLELGLPIPHDGRRGLGHMAQRSLFMRQRFDAINIKYDRGLLKFTDQEILEKTKDICSRFDSTMIELDINDSVAACCERRDKWLRGVAKDGAECCEQTNK